MKALFILSLFIASYCSAQQITDSIINRLYVYVSRGDSSDYVIRTCENYFRQDGEMRHKLKVVYCEGRACLDKKMNSKAMACFKVALTCPDENLTNSFQNESARYIAKIYMGEKKYDSALYYLDIAKTKYDYLSFGFLENYIYYTWDMSMCYAQCYKGKGEYQKAIDELAPHMHRSIFTASGNNWMMDSLYELYKLIHTKKDVKQEFINACNTVRVQVINHKDDSISAMYSYVTIFGKKILFDDWGINLKHVFGDKPVTINEADLRQEGIKFFKDTYMYKLVTK